MALIGYARVSTEDQATARQLDELRAAGCREVAEEHASGADRDRPVLARTLARLRPGDTLVVVSLDRLARSLSHLLGVVEGLQARGVHFRSLRDPVDTASPQGLFTLQVLGAAAQLERALIRERTRSGMRAAAARGSRPGNPGLRAGDPAARRATSEARRASYLARLVAGADAWLPAGAAVADGRPRLGRCRPLPQCPSRRGGAALDRGALGPGGAADGGGRLGRAPRSSPRPGRHRRLTGCWPSWLASCGPTRVPRCARLARGWRPSASRHPAVARPGSRDRWRMSSPAPGRRACCRARSGRDRRRPCDPIAMPAGAGQSHQLGHRSTNAGRASVPVASIRNRDRRCQPLVAIGASADTGSRTALMEPERKAPASRDGPGEAPRARVSGRELPDLALRDRRR